MHSVEVKTISPADVIDLRHKLLRPNSSKKACIYPDDDHPRTMHFGAFGEQQLIGIATLLPQNQNETISSNQWRLRGMAVEPDWRGKNIGQKLLKSCIDHASTQNNQRIWCNARESAMPFYLKFGFQAFGDKFDLPGIGPHYIMEINL